MGGRVKRLRRARGCRERVNTGAALSGTDLLPFKESSLLENEMEKEKECQILGKGGTDMGQGGRRKGPDRERERERGRDTAGGRETEFDNGKGKEREERAGL